MCSVLIVFVRVRFKIENIWEKKDAVYAKLLMQFKHITTARKPIEVKAISTFSAKFTEVIVFIIYGLNVFFNVGFEF